MGLLDASWSVDRSGVGGVWLYIQYEVLDAWYFLIFLIILVGVGVCIVY